MSPLLVLSQEEAIILIIPGVESKIRLDGIEQGVARASSALRVVTSPGEHYVECYPIDGTPAKGELITLETGKQKILKIEFPIVQKEAMTLIDVADINFNLPGTMDVIAWNSKNSDKPFPYPEHYYAFEKGDEIHLDLTMSNEKGTNSISIATHPDGVERYVNKSFTSLNNLTIKVQERAIYRFRFISNHIFPRNAFLKVRRKPESEQTLAFNTNVTLKRKITPVLLVESENHFINGGTYAIFAGGKSRVVIPVNLPPNTIEWIYRFSAFRTKEQLEKAKGNLSLFKEIGKLTFTTPGAGAVFTLAMDKLTQPPGADYCTIYLLERQYIQPFEAKLEQQWRYIQDGSRENLTGGNVKVSCCNSGTFYLGIKNPSANYGINITVDIVALTAIEDYVMDQP